VSSSTIFHVAAEIQVDRGRANRFSFTIDFCNQEIDYRAKEILICLLDIVCAQPPEHP
jgi:hypothetical protein